MSAIISNSPAPPSAVFVYGTLMQGQPQHSRLTEGGVVAITPASIAGELLDLGDYPALRMSAYVNTRVHGEVIQIESLDKILKQLDEYEGPEFKREIVNVTLDDGGSHFAWTYVLASDAGQFQAIASGRWREKAAGA